MNIGYHWSVTCSDFQVASRTSKPYIRPNIRYKIRYEYVASKSSVRVVKNIILYKFASLDRGLIFENHIVASREVHLYAETFARIEHNFASFLVARNFLVKLSNGSCIECKSPRHNVTGTVISPFFAPKLDQTYATEVMPRGTPMILCAPVYRMLGKVCFWRGGLHVTNSNQA